MMGDWMLIENPLPALQNWSLFCTGLSTWISLWGGDSSQGVRPEPVPFSWHCRYGETWCRIEFNMYGIASCIRKKLISSIIYKSAVNKWLQALFVGSFKSQVSFSRVEKKLQLNHSEFGWLCSRSLVEGNFLRIVGISRKDPRDKFTETDPIVVIPRHRFLLMTKRRWEKQETERFMRR